MAKEKTIETKGNLIEFNFPVEGVTVLAVNIDEANAKLAAINSKS
jgi:hypothetical protein